MFKQTPIYDICNLAEFNEEEIIVSRFAPYLERHKNLSSAHRHTFYHLVLFTQGGGSHHVDFEEFAVKPYQIYFMLPGQVHSWKFEGFTDGYIINFSPSFLHSFLLNPSFLDAFSFFNGDVNDAVIDLPAASHQVIKNLLEEVVKEKAEKLLFYKDMLRVMILQLFIILGRLTNNVHVGNGASSYNRVLLKNFQKLVDGNFITLRLPKDYADLLYITPNHLNAICKDLLGLSAGETIRKRVMLEAKRLLTNKQLTISQIAFELNFSDNSYFTKFFKKYEGITPEEFRKNIFHHHRYD